MKEDIRNLYQEMIIDHAKNPRNYKILSAFTHHAEGWNPLCGDQLNLYLEVDQEDIIQNISFQGSGCAISTASASLLTEKIKGKAITEAYAIFKDFQDLLIKDPPLPTPSDLGKLNVLAGVRLYPARVKCATLAWHTLIAALENEKTPISTEDAAGQGA